MKPSKPRQKSKKMIENLEEIKAKANIVEVISQYIPLRKEGANFTANCPFHEERSASFKVNPQKQFYHCFGCGVGGDVFKFVQEYKHLSFEDAVLEVADAQNIFAKVGARGFDKKAYLEVLDKVNNMFQNALLNQPQLLKYLQNRGLNLEDLRLFSIGYIPKDFYKELTTEENKLLCDLGLLVRGEFGHYAPLGERISFAMRNFAHKVVGFSARTHPYANFKNTAKYINSKESQIFHKSQILYNLSLAKTSIAKVHEVWIVEGFMDAIALYKLGFKNVVATCGTAFNATHLSAIINFTQARLVFCFDNDIAGFQANLRALNLCFRQRIYDCKVAQLQNEAKDIGDVLKSGEELKIKKMQGFLYFCKAKLQNAKTTQERDRILSEIQDFINKESAYYAKNRLIELAAFAFGIPKDYFPKPKGEASQIPIQQPCEVFTKNL